MVGVAVGWHVYEVTRSALSLGLVGLVQFLPALLLVLVVGHAADRYDRRRLVSLAQGVEGVAMVGLAGSCLAGWVSPELIFLFIFLLGTARSFEYATLQTLVPSIVDPDDLPSALALSGSVMQGAVIAGPMLGGFLYLLGPVAVYLTAAVLFFFSSVAVRRMRLKTVTARRERPSLDTIFAGIHFIRSRPVLLGAISFDLFAVLLGGVTALLPIYARDILHATPRGLGLLRAAPALGAFIASLYLARRPLRRRVGSIMFGAVGVFGLATIVFALSRSMTLSFFALALLGMADMLSVVIRSSLVQLETPDEMRGRVSAVNSVFIGASNQLGEFESGLTASWFGTVPAAVLGGIGTLVVVFLWRIWFPQLASRNTLQSEERTAT
ncbi:MFS transporter [Geomonas sp. Red875]|uniref:MFS transporter n=2 Tax=Geomesophilobacter sediminis TaxID=2798584 RepID=A0A8J7J613_9BACT|nr:MFS transporter [Geomesophilobacter sediminis]